MFLVHSSRVWSTLGKFACRLITLSGSILGRMAIKGSQIKRAFYEHCYSRVSRDAKKYFIISIPLSSLSTFSLFSCLLLWKPFRREKSFGYWKEITFFEKKMECVRFSPRSKSHSPIFSGRLLTRQELVFLEFGSVASGVSFRAMPNNSTLLFMDEEEGGIDWFCWLVEGVFIMIVGSLGLLGNSLSLYTFSRQKVHRIFHNLLLTLTIYDLVRR